MFRIRRIYDDLLPVNQEALRQVLEMMPERFAGIHATDIDKIPEMLVNPMKHRFRAILYVAENLRGVVQGFALVSHEPELKFCFLDYLSSSRQYQGGGIGGVLYERVRDEALGLGVIGIFCECLPDDPALCPDPAQLEQNRARLRFYERYGARPVINTAYETPLSPAHDNPPYLVFDDLGQGRTPGREQARVIVRSILERKYGELCPPGYIEMVVASLRDKTLALRARRYTHRRSVTGASCRGRFGRIALVVNDRHAIHHVRERGYVESPVRIDAILDELTSTKLFERIPPGRFSEKHILSVHARSYVEYFKKVCGALEPGRSVYPYVFPLRNQSRAPRELAVRAGYYCIDTFTPLNQNAYLAAKHGVDCTLTAARALLKGYRLAYSLVRPPGHHAEERVFGGFCYFNNAAIAATYLGKFGRVAILDIDYHHGNGQQQIFYARRDVLTVSIHGHPRFAYPYFSGFADERGQGEGRGFNLNYPLKEHITAVEYLAVCEQALEKVAEYAPAYLIVCLGLDTARGDPTGTWPLVARDFEQVGRRIGALRRPTLIQQEGGYRTRTIGVNARHFFVGLCTGTLGELHLGPVRGSGRKKRASARVQGSRE